MLAIESQGFEQLQLHAQINAKPFYERLGYQALETPEFLEANILHQTMQKNL